MNHVQLQPLEICCTSISTQATHLLVHTLKTMVAGEEHWCDRLNLLWQGTRTWNCRGSLLYSSDTPCMYSSSSVVKILRFTLNVLERQYKGFSLCAMSVLCPPTVYPMLNCESAFQQWMQPHRRHDMIKLKMIGGLLNDLWISTAHCFY